MKRLLLAMMVLSFVHTTSFAQLTDSLSSQFVKVKCDLLKATTSRQMKDASKSLDAFLSHVNITRCDSNFHNQIPFLSCQYEGIPLTMSAILRQGTISDTIQFQNGRWYITKDLSQDMKIDLLCFDNNGTPNNKKLKSTIEAIKQRYTYLLGDGLADKNGSLFFVRDENLYYAAIESKNIPAFDILSNNEIINYATCLKTILKASNIESSYDEIIGNYLCTTLDERHVPIKNNSRTIAGRKVETTFLPQTKIEVNEILNELVKNRFLIAIDKDGNVGLLTAIAMSGEKNYQPVHVRMRMPKLAIDEQRVQMSWRDFSNRVVALVKVEIYSVINI